MSWGVGGKELGKNVPIGYIMKWWDWNVGRDVCVLEWGEGLCDLGRHTTIDFPNRSKAVAKSPSSLLN